MSVGWADGGLKREPKHPFRVNANPHYKIVNFSLDSIGNLDDNRAHRYKRCAGFLDRRWLLYERPAAVERGARRGCLSIFSALKLLDDNSKSNFAVKGCV
jgi:hypothetical protein